MKMCLVMILVKKVFIFSKTMIICLLCPLLCGLFFFWKGAKGELSYKAKNTISGVFLLIYTDYFAFILLFLQINLRINHVFVIKFRLSSLNTGCLMNLVYPLSFLCVRTFMYMSVQRKKWLFFFQKFVNINRALYPNLDSATVLISIPQAACA